MDVKGTDLAFQDPCRALFPPEPGSALITAVLACRAGAAWQHIATPSARVPVPEDDVSDLAAWANLRGAFNQEGRKVDRHPGSDNRSC